MQTCQDKIVNLYTAFDSPGERLRQRSEFDLVRSMMAADFKADLVGLPEPLDRDGFIAFGRQFRSAFPDSYHRIDEIVEQGDRVVTIGKIFGTHTGKFQGLPATGKKIEIEFAHLDSAKLTLRERVAGDRVIYHWGQGNQIGTIDKSALFFCPDYRY